MAVLSRAAIPRLGDYCVIDMLGASGEVESFEVAHAVVAKEPLAREYRTSYPPGARNPRTPIYAALRTGTPVVASGLPESFMADVAVDPRQQELLTVLRPRSFIIHPLFARGRTIGAISFCASEADRTYSPAEVELAAEIARRGALAYDNATLYVEAQRANKIKADFLAVMSHELRTPLTAITGYAELVANGVVVPVNATQKAHAERIVASSEHLRMLIDDILSFSRIEAGRGLVAMESFDVVETCRDAVAMVDPIASRKRLTLDVQGLESLVVVSDRVKVRQILINLLANAVKFTDHGRVIITNARSDSTATISVRDTGPGIAPAQLPHVFEEFWQADQSLRRRHGGTGLGLSVARRLARLLGGDVGVQSEPGSGAAFTLTLPIAPPAGSPSELRASGTEVPAI